MKRATTILLFGFLLLGGRAGAQKDTLVDHWMMRADGYLQKEKHDSALIFFRRSLERIRSTGHDDPRAAIALNSIGDIYRIKEQAAPAHQHLTEALQLARKLKLQYEKETAIYNLLQLHQDIIKKDLSFSYPAIAEKEVSEAWYQLIEITPAGDSLDAVIGAGYLDGVADTIASVDIYMHISPKDTVYHKDLDFYGIGRVVKVGANQTTIRVKKKGVIPLLKGDFAITRAAVPLPWRKLFFREFMLSGLYLVGNYRQPLFHHRYMYYYGDSLLEKDILDAMRSTVSEVVEMFGEDTLTNPDYARKSPEGIFTGKNFMRALHESKPEHIRLFLDYVIRYRAKYVGNDYRFAETFATWIINHTPLAEADMKPYLLSLPKQERRIQARYLSGQIIKERLLDRWLDEGMQQVAADNLAEAGITAELVHEVAEVADTARSGWGEYLFANIEKRLSHTDRADSFLAAAATRFNSLQNQEGLDWVSNTRARWKAGSRVEVGVQNGHILPYIIELSPNPRYFATGGKDNLVKIWDRTLGKEIQTLRAHNAEINGLHYSPNGRYLVSVGEDSLVCVWNAYNYTLMYRYRSTTVERAVRFSPDNEFIVTGGADSLIRFRDVRTGRLVKTYSLHKGAVNSLAFHPVFSQVLYSASDDSMVYKWSTISDEMTRWYKHKGGALSVQVSPNGKYMSVVSTDSILQVWNTEDHFKMFWMKIHTQHNQWATSYSSETFSPDSRYIACVFRKDSIAVIRIQDLYERWYSTLLNGHHVMDLKFSNDGRSLYARFDMGGPLRVYNFAGWDISESPNISWRDIRPYGNIITSVQFTRDDNGLAILHNQVSLLDLRNGNLERLFYGYSLVDNKYLLLDDERVGTYIDNNKPVLYFYDYGKAENVRYFSLPEAEKIGSWELSPGSGMVFMASGSGVVNGWDANTGKPVFTTRVSLRGDGIGSLRFDKYDSLLYVVDNGQRIIVLDARTGNTLYEVPVPGANYISSTKENIYVSTTAGKLIRVSKKEKRTVKEILLNTDSEESYQLVISDDEELLSVISSTEELTTVRLKDDSVLYRVKDHEFAGTMLAISHDGKRIATAGLDSKVNLYDARTGRRLVDIHLPMDKGVLIADPQGRYLASRHTLEAIMFSFNGTAYSYDQFDARLNRPDLILERIGRADTNLLLAYRAAYQKRLKKLGVDERDLAGAVEMPVVRLEDKHALQTITTQKEFRLRFVCSDSRYPLQSLQVLVNNTPVLGTKGRDLSLLNTRNTVQEVLIPLSTGINNIKVFCTNEKGVSSLKESIDVISKYKADKPARTYFIGIGTAAYKDSRMNLQYSAKDIRDLATTFDNLYYDLSIDTLIDRKATRENILALKKKLMQTTVNDRVILAVTGHGLLSDSLDFYYATWDIDFNNPEKRGVRYEELEDLLDNIPARQKLMLIDACHSGALDKEELLALRSDSATIVTSGAEDSAVTGRAPRGFGLRNKKQKMEANSSFEMMQNLFTDLSGGNGAVIISAAGGMEYAFESGQWNNGVFTYCVRKGIEEKAADRAGNFDGKVSVQELLKYVSAKVSELTNGKQKPTSRRENIDFEWNLRN